MDRLGIDNAEEAAEHLRYIRPKSAMLAATEVGETDLALSDDLELAIAEGAAVVRVPIYGSPLSAGRGTVVDDLIIGYATYLVEFLRRHGINPHRAFINEVIGDSMIPLFNPGELVLGHFVEEWHGDGIYAVQLNGENYLKTLTRVRGVYSLSSANRRYDTVQVDPALDELRIIGKIFLAVRSVYR